ncbi:hypothetical protein A2U01_0115791, partial [Trifolium medium]|nr:hypothetical protein [Trifolium medium]
MSSTERAKESDLILLMEKLVEGPPLHFIGALAKPYKGKQL